MDYSAITQKLVAARLRPTRQRILLATLLFTEECRHVTAEALHKEAKLAGIDVSLATVYNTLHQFTDANLLHEFSVEGGKSYFDTNTCMHHHFLCEETGRLIDIPEEDIQLALLPLPPAGMQVRCIDVVIRMYPATQDTPRAA